MNSIVTSRKGKMEVNTSGKQSFFFYIKKRYNQWKYKEGCMLIISFIVHQSDSLKDLLHTLTTVTLFMCYDVPSS